MKWQIVVDGGRNLRESSKHQARLRELRASIMARHTAELQAAGFFRCWVLRRRIAAEFERERCKLGLSAHSLFHGRLDACCR